MKGRLIDLSFTRDRRQRLTLELDGDFTGQYDELNGSDVEITVKKFRKHRSIGANAYAWVLIDKIAAALQQDKEVVYRQAIRDIGGVSTIVCVKNAAVDSLRKSWAHHGIGWSSDVLESKLEGCTNVVLYYGSSVYDSEQMSNLIEHLVQDAKELGIETLPPDELRRMGVEA